MTTRLAALLIILIWSHPLMAIEEPAYDVLASGPDVEFRQYAPYLVAETVVDASVERNEAANIGFKIAMTAPVLMKHEGENTGMSLIVPKDVATAKVPAPKDSAVMMDSLPAGQFAVYRYSGGRNEANEQEALGKLRAWVEKRQLQVTGEPLFGYYDPPWIPPFMRRNEVMLRLAGTQP